MEIRICKDRAALGKSAALYVAQRLREVIAEKGEARIALSTGASQFDTLAYLVQQDVPWERVVMFHLDEYVDLPETHPASFRKYLKEKFTSKVTVKEAHFVDGTEENRRELCRLIAEAPIDVGLIGIGENGHIAFNDPPADFDARDPYIVVTLNDTCKQQQVGEGWFATPDDVPKQAVSMSVGQIMKCREIVSCVPYAVKASAVYNTLTQPVNNMVPATIMKTHPAFTLYIDGESAKQILPDIHWTNA